MQLEPEIVSTFAMEKGLNISLLGKYTLQNTFEDEVIYPST
jgi:hypothetical protein